MDDQLDENWRDRAATAIKTAASLVPILGGPLGEILSETIPRLRQDRIVEFLRLVETRLTHLEKNDYVKLSNSAEALDLVEEGGYAAVRAIGEARLNQIAEIVSRGLQRDEADIERHKRLLKTLSLLDNDEVALLVAYGSDYMASDDNEELWEKTNRPNPAHMGSSQEEIDQETLFELGRTRLIQMGLLYERHPNTKRGDLPPYDNLKRKFKVNVEISPLGRLLLREIGFDIII